jgi:hypothetical protein
MFSLQAIQLAPGRASQPKESYEAAHNKQNKAEEAHLYQWPLPGDTSEATRGMICSNHTNPSMNISAQMRTKQTNLQALGYCWHAPGYGCRCGA